jgi:hypothetical protein
MNHVVRFSNDVIQGSAFEGLQADTRDILTRLLEVFSVAHGSRRMRLSCSVSVAETYSATERHRRGGAPFLCVARNQR